MKPQTLNFIGVALGTSAFVSCVKERVDLEGERLSDISEQGDRKNVYNVKKPKLTVEFLLISHFRADWSITEFCVGASEGCR
jgi:hypothetical protein